MTALVPSPVMASVAVRTTSVAARTRRVTPVAFVDRSPSTTAPRGVGTAAVFPVQRNGSRTMRPMRHRRVAVRVHAAKGETSADPNAPLGPNKTAADAVNNGLACFEKRRYDAAVRNFSAALKDFGSASEDESRAALYNRACAYVKLTKYDEAKVDLKSAINDYNLKFSVVLKDPDMEVFRGTPQYEEMEAEEVKGFRSNKSVQKLKAEAQEPFRFVKLYAFGGLGAGAFIGLIIILSRLSLAIQGGDDAPALDETILNLLVNATAVAGFAYLFNNELKAREKTEAKVAREEELGRLRMAIEESKEDVLVSQLRGNYRLFIIAGSDEHCDEAMGQLVKYKAKLKEEKVVITTVDMLTGGGKKKKATKAPGAAMAALKAEFAAEKESSDDGSAPALAEPMEFGKKSKRAEVAASATRVAEKKWRVAPLDEDAWRAWIVDEIERNGFDPTVRDVFFSVGKDGTLWKSGAGTPNWMKIIEELPTSGLTGV